MKVILFLFQVGANSILVLKGSKIISLGLSGSKINLERNDLRLDESLLRHGCQNAFLDAIWPTRHIKLPGHSYRIEMSKDALFEPSKERQTKAMEIK